MSETAAPPAAPAIPAAAQPATPAPPNPANVVNAPAPASQEQLSLSDAGRLLARRRAEQAREGQPAAPAARPPAAPTAPPAAAKEAPAAKPADSYDTIARALGLDQGVPAPGLDPGGAPSAEASRDAAGLDIDGTRYSSQQLRQAVLQAADYTRKTQALAEQQRHLQSQADALAAVLPHIQPELARLTQQLQGVAQPDHTLIDANPQEYLRQFHAYQQSIAEQQRLGSLSQLQQQAYERALTQQVDAGNKTLAEKYEFWRDDAMRTTVQRDIAAWAEAKGGYRRNELQGLSDPRHVEAMMKAMMWDRMVDGAKTTAPAQPQTARVRGTAPPPAPGATVAAAEQAFDAAPNARNAATLLAARRSSAGVENGRY